MLSRRLRVSQRCETLTCRHRWRFYSFATQPQKRLHALRVEREARLQDRLRRHAARLYAAQGQGRSILLRRHERHEVSASKEFGFAELISHRKRLALDAAIDCVRPQADDRRRLLDGQQPVLASVGEDEITRVPATVDHDFQFRRERG